jgi:hypothetical protein
MAMRAPNTRKQLSADALLGLLRTGFAAIAAHRPGKPDLALTDARMSAFALFSRKAPALRAFDRERTAGNWPRVDGIGRVPGETAMRERLEPVAPESLRPLCKQVFRALQRGNALEEMVCVAGHYLLARDGTGDFSSHQMHCASCRETHHRNGPIPSRHHMLGAARMHPDKRAVLPLRPAPMVQPDGTDTNDCARNAAQRCITKLRQDYPPRNLLVTEDSLSANAPHLEVLQAHTLHYLLGITAGDHAHFFAQVAAAEHAGRVMDYARDAPERGLRHRLRLVRDVPRNASHADLRVHFLECGEWDQDQVHHCSWLTDLRVNTGTVYQLMRGGRARWRIENEPFTTLQNQGDHCAHTCGHGYQQLSGVFAVLMLLAFLVDQVQQRCCPLFQAVWAKLGRKRPRWERMRALLDDDALESMRHLFDALFSGLKKPAPVLAWDSS